MFRILIVDSNILFREGLTNLLQREPEICVTGEAGTIYEAAEMCKELKPDLALVDADLPDLEEFQGIRLLKTLLPQMQIVMMSSHESEDLLLQAVRSGARGILAKNHSLSRFMTAIHALERGEAVVPRAMVGRLLDELSHLSSPEGQEGLNMLTQRELQVLYELGRGLSNKQIANHLQIAENTVKVHVHNILDKLNLQNRRHASRFARLHGLTSVNFLQFPGQTTEELVVEAFALNSAPARAST